MQALKENLRANGEEEKVEVNQRHLIDKILARYSAENTIFRELLQNSNDAQATAAEIHFKTSPPPVDEAPPTPPPKPPASSSFFGALVSSFVVSAASTINQAVGIKKPALPTVTQVIYKNNGRPFAGEDWGRLRKIAEGNPDETKIGFFGVGFYSLFSICEEPFVTSGNECMAFFWKGDQLFTKKGPVKDEDASPLTSFFLDLREPIDVPNVGDFGRFLANSLAFTKNLKKVEVFVDDVRILLFDKKAAEPRPMAFPRGIYNLTSPNNIFELKTINVSKVQLDLKVFLDFDHESKKLGDESTFTIYMRIATASVGVRLSAQLSKEMERTTKKRAPAITDFHIQFSNYDEYDSSTTARSGRGGIFHDLIPGPKDQGKVFIGFPTHQTTGCSIHLAAHLIPTVERESIDFVDRSLNIWNQDLLTVSGLLSRIIFEDEMGSIGELFTGASLDEATQQWLFKRASHALSAFTFRQSTPSNIVGRLNQMFFIKGSNKPMSMISTKGVLPLPSVRLPDPAMKGFIKEIPTVPSETLTNCADLIRELQSNNMIQTLGLADVLQELGKRTLSIEEVIELLKWWRVYKRTNAISLSDAAQMFQLLVIVDPSTPEKAPVRMFDLKHHVNIKTIPPGLPLPDSVLSMEVSKHFTKPDLEEAVGFITELSIPQWLAFVITLAEFKENPPFVEKVMQVVSRQFSNLNRDSQNYIIEVLSARNCIVTKHGLKLPGESYFKSVTLFDDLPVVMFESGKTISDAFLKALGVREHVDLAMVFARLQDLKWDSDHVQLVRYLTSVQDKLTTAEIARLKATSVFTKEDVVSNTESVQDPGVEAIVVVKKERFKASDLYAPTDSIRALGLPLLDWPGKVKWRSTSDEAKFMFRLGLKQTIPWEELVERAAKSETPALRFQFIDYFLENWKTTYVSSFDPMSVRFAFLPAEGSEKLYRPRELYGNPGVAVLGFPFLHASLQQHADKFGVREHPNGMTLINVLKTNPPTQETAVKVFTYFSGRQSEFSSSEWNVIRSLKFIPVTTPKDSPLNPGSVTWIEPTKVYFGSKNSSAYQDLFTHIDFGETSNAFLRACGVKDEPTPQELAEQLVRNPQAFMNQLGFAKYLQVLRTIAANYYQLRHNRNLVSEMRNSAFLVGVKTETSEDENGASQEDEKLHYQLASAKEIYIMDDTVLGQIFTPLGCPIETLLEDMYSDLGSQWLTTQVTEVTTPRGNTSSSERTQKLQALINERALLLLYDGQQVRPSKDIVPGSEETLKNLEVMEVPEIIIERTFRGLVRTQKTTCCLMMDKRTRKYYLLITRNESEVDYFDVAQALGKVIFRKCRLNDALLLSSLLSTSLINLKRKGFPVDRILNLQEGKLKAAIAKRQEEAAKAQELQKQQQQQREAERQAAEARYTESQSKQTSLDKKPTSNLTPDPKQVAVTSTLLTMFPDIDRDYLHSLVESEKSNPKAIEAISNKLLDSDYPKSQNLPTPPATASAQTERPPSSSSSSSSQNDFKSPLGSKDDLLKSVKDTVKSGFLGNLWDKATGSSSSINSTKSEQQKLMQNSGQTPAAGGNGGGVPTPGGMKPMTEEITPQYTQNLKQQLTSSINTVKPAYDQSFRATIPNEPEPTANVPTRHANQVCTPLSDSDLVLHEKLVNEIPFYIDKNALHEAKAVANVSRVALMRFVDILRLLAAVFGLEARTLNIYWDATGATVAFNRGRTLFFNFRFYLGLHYKEGMKAGIAGEDVETVYYWFMVACHELAHNFVSQHDANHEFYFSSYAENYLAKLNRTLKLAGLEP
ncbi:hypothetical protein HDU79_005116 [Rhizoclosmatium sp. JEL0117]|nr:hypothetical protein HDU79_005116 [Rhizoclosmatium sp. JEL0117]